MAQRFPLWSGNQCADISNRSYESVLLHGIEDFHIVNDDTLASPAFVERGKMQQFDVVVANPPYSITSGIELLLRKISTAGIS